MSKRSQRSKSSAKSIDGQEIRAAENEDLWSKAYQALAKDYEGLVKRYERILHKEEGSGRNTTTITHSPKRLAALAKRKLDGLENSKWRVSIGSRKFVVQDGMDKFVTGVITAKDFVASAGFMASEPHAALAWTGVCICLPVSLR